MSTLSWFACVALLASAACGGSASQPAQTASSASPATFADQVALGQKLYGEQCASCHGPSGEGKGGPRVVGLKDGALPVDAPATAKYRKTKFKTVADVADFVVKAMPPAAPGSLPADSYWAILAFDLKANGIDLGSKKLDSALAATLTIPR
jgi:cytochrome c